MRGDEGKLRQVLINLLGNAVKFTERGRVTLRAEPMRGDRVELRGRGHRHRHRAGSAAADLRAVPARPDARGRGGTGLGLTIARRQVELMGGALEVESAPGAGSRFFFTIDLPAAAPRAEEPR